MIITKTKKVNEISMSVLYIYSVFFLSLSFFVLSFLLLWVILQENALVMLKPIDTNQRV